MLIVFWAFFYFVKLFLQTSQEERFAGVPCPTALFQVGDDDNKQPAATWPEGYADFPSSSSLAEAASTTSTDSSSSTGSEEGEEAVQLFRNKILLLFLSLSLLTGKKKTVLFPN